MVVLFFDRWRWVAGIEFTLSAFDRATIGHRGKVIDGQCEQILTRHRLFHFFCNPFGQFARRHGADVRPQLHHTARDVAVIVRFGPIVERRQA